MPVESLDLLSNDDLKKRVLCLVDVDLVEDQVFFMHKEGEGASRCSYEGME